MLPCVTVITTAFLIKTSSCAAGEEGAGCPCTLEVTIANKRKIPIVRRFIERLLPEERNTKKRDSRSELQQRQFKHLASVMMWNRGVIRETTTRSADHLRSDRPVRVMYQRSSKRRSHFSADRADLGESSRTTRRATVGSILAPEP